MAVTSLLHVVRLVEEVIHSGGRYGKSIRSTRLKCSTLGASFHLKRGLRIIDKSAGCGWSLSAAETVVRFACRIETRGDLSRCLRFIHRLITGTEWLERSTSRIRCV